MSASLTSALNTNTNARVMTPASVPSTNATSTPVNALIVLLTVVNALRMELALNTVINV